MADAPTDIKRYDLVSQMGSGVEIGPLSNGDYVRYEDYAALRAQLATAEQALFHSRKDTEAARGDRDRFQRERDEARRQFRDECAIVDRVWRVLGVTTYDGGPEISERVAALLSDLTAAREALTYHAGDLTRYATRLVQAHELLVKGPTGVPTLAYELADVASLLRVKAAAMMPVPTAPVTPEPVEESR